MIAADRLGFRRSVRSFVHSWVSCTCRLFWYVCILWGSTQSIQQTVDKFDPDTNFCRVPFFFLF